MQAPRPALRYPRGPRRSAAASRCCTRGFESLQEEPETRKRTDKHAKRGAARGYRHTHRRKRGGPMSRVVVVTGASAAVGRATALAGARATHGICAGKSAARNPQVCLSEHRGWLAAAGAGAAGLAVLAR